MPPHLHYIHNDQLPPRLIDRTDRTEAESCSAAERNSRGQKSKTPANSRSRHTAESRHATGNYRRLMRRSGS